MKTYQITMLNGGRAHQLLIEATSEFGATILAQKEYPSGVIGSCAVLLKPLIPTETPDNVIYVDFRLKKRI